MIQSTPSVGRATELQAYADRLRNISIHALRGEGDHRIRDNLSDAKRISIHALRGEGDITPLAIFPRMWHFNPRPPWGGRPVYGIAAGPRQNISIHALRGEGDLVDMFSDCPLWDISIHALRGEGDFSCVGRSI